MANYEIGYKKPPKHTRYQSGESGNKKGRKKGTKNLKTELLEELAEKIPIKEGGQLKKVSKQRAMLKALTAKAVQGDPRAANVIINMTYRLLNDQTEDLHTEDLSQTDQAILEDFATKILQSKPEGSPAEKKRRRKNND
jgi:hypothetical protein